MRLDEDIKKDIVDQIYWDDRVDASEVEATVENGVVTLAGHVPNYRARRAAYDDAWIVSGVTSVINQIKVRSPTLPAPPSDSEIKTHVQNALRYDPNIFDFKIDVGVKARVVTLKGAVDAYWKKIQAEEIADGVRGVIAVTNELAVVPTEEAEDEQIAKSVVKALERNTNVNVDDITVTVKNGGVILAGTVPSYTAKRSAYNAAFYTAGVVSVIDQGLVVRSRERELAL